MISFETDDRAPADLGRVLERVLPFHPHAREVARAVEALWDEEVGQPVLASDRTLLQAARALASVGDVQASNVVLSTITSLADWSGRILLSDLPASTARLMESGLVRAAPSAVLGTGLLVQVDMRLLSVDASALELVYIPVVHRLVDACIPLWRGVGGQGALVVHGLVAHAGPARGRGRRGGDPGAWLRSAFQHRLEWWGDREGWSQAPWLVQAS